MCMCSGIQNEIKSEIRIPKATTVFFLQHFSVMIGNITVNPARPPIGPVRFDTS